MNLSGVIKRPLLSEKSLTQKESDNIYSFEVSSQANKYQIRLALEGIFKVKIEDVRTINIRGKNRRVGKSFGKRSNWKKALVKIKNGQKIEMFEGLL